MVTDCDVVVGGGVRCGDSGESEDELGDGVKSDGVKSDGEGDD